MLCSYQLSIARPLCVKPSFKLLNWLWLGFIQCLCVDAWKKMQFKQFQWGSV